jgi:dTDP-glucose 4,6-dehydratase
MRILVTGGAGFIGANFVRYMLGAYPGYRIVNLDLLTYAGNLENLAGIESRENYRFVRGDIRNEALLEELFAAGLDAVVNFAAESHVDRSIEDPAHFLKTNVLGTQALLEAARRHGAPRFLQVSTDEVYGSLGAEGRFSETSDLAPNSPYSASKAAADLLVRAYGKTYGLPVLVTRCSNNYGPYQFPEKLIPLFITNALEDTPLPVYGDGLYVRDWIYVEDHCAALDRVLHDAEPGQLYNVGADEERTNLEITDIILRALGKAPSLIRHVKDRPGHDRRYAIDSSKIRDRLGWRPQISFVDGMRRTIRWYIDNEPWWRKIKSGEYLRYYERMYGDR